MENGPSARQTSYVNLHRVFQIVRESLDQKWPSLNASALGETAGDEEEKN